MHVNGQERGQNVAGAAVTGWSCTVRGGDGNRICPRVTFYVS